MSMNKLTNREKKSIYFLICFLVATIGLLVLIFPTYNKLNSTELAILDEQTAKDRMDSDLAQLPVLRQTLPELQKQVRMAAGYFYQPMTTDEADQLVTGLLTKHGFKPVSLTLDTFVETTVPPYLSAYTNELQTAEEQKADDTENIDTSTDPEAKAGDETQPETAEAAEPQPTTTDSGQTETTGRTVLAGSHITAVVTARTTKPFQDLCDEVSNMAGLRIVAYSYQESTTSLFSTNVAPKVYEFTIEFEVLTYQPTQMGTGYEINADDSAEPQKEDAATTK